ncbi:unnamed protein product [Ostreobium quekettii]|uniref:GHMP kinase C-terminal domain-containing protein n=1 Tax=Ostreobium quekettii TaxID=121088 RepID=A0A8S1J5J1_9CHLO|nr:unnamed protein product [Ostreobium quekettii]|eukprot:evm.model.scf_1255.2 EVM.evm.TU.scf_1255.2   scf_1255:17931-19958(-)
MEGLWPVNAVNASVNAVNVLIVVRSNVAEGRGVASSAAVEVAAMKALLAAVGRADLPGRDLALLCQKVENLVVGAPCGVMDQMASAMGPPARLLPILCHTAEAQPPISIPDHIRLYGIDSGVLHSVRDDAYCRVRAAAFMGLKMISDMKKVLPSCLAALSPSEWIGDLEEILPAEISGEEFLAAHGPHVDHVTTVDDHMHYRIRAATRHPILENFRVKLFRQLLGAPPSNAQLLALGELMFQSHASYRACGLGSKGTDAIVDLVKHEADLVTGQRPGVDQVNTQALTLGGVFGAKSSGAGCGGTVCVMASNDDAGRAAVERVAREYGERYGIEGRIFDMKYGERHRACSWCVKVCREG